jgi:SAM-dependent methyltransferase
MPNLYDEIDYVSRPFRQTHPDRLAAIAQLFGIAATDPAKAATMPSAKFYGFDLATAPIQRAQARIAELGLSNIEVETLDLLHFPEDRGEFDYILAQGFYSWVPDAVRQAYLRLLARHLAPNGIAYVSFNAYPGAMLRHAWRDGAAFHTAAMGVTDPKERIVESCRMLELMATATAKQDSWSTIAGEMVRAVQTKGMNWVGHDDFGPFFQPFYFHEVAEAAASHGLQYLSDAVYTDTLPHSVTAEVQPILAGLAEKNPILREQYYDFIELRPFRQSLFCRQELKVDRPERADRLRALSFSSAAEVKSVSSDGSATVHNPLTGMTVEVPGPMRRVVQQLRLAWPGSLPFAEIELTETNRARVAETLLQLYGVALLEAHAVPQVCGTGKEERPKAFGLAWVEAGAGPVVTTRLHTQIQLDAVSVQLVRRLDGTRTRKQLAAEFQDLDGRLEWLASFGILDPAHS